MNKLAIFVGKSVIAFSKAFNLGSGSTWPGHIVLKFNPEFIEKTLKKSKTTIILIAGTNGKTTTAKLLKSILEESNKTVFHNQSGANLLNGLASAIVSEVNLSGYINKNYAIFEVDENTLPSALDKFLPDYLIVLNLFRDQLDRYGEIDKIAKNWKKSFEKLPASTTLILNADDPLVSFLSENLSSKMFFFGLNDDKYKINSKQNAADSIYCLYCGNKLSYKATFFSHIGDWQCTKCLHKRQKLDLSEIFTSPLKGTYNAYNVLAASLTAKKIGIKDEVIKKSVLSFKPAFGRQEIISIKGKEIQIFLSKNPTSFNESLRTIKSLNGKNVLIVLNDRIPDGRDISWIWDTDIENLFTGDEKIVVSGDRAYDLALRIKYAGFKNFSVEPVLKKAVYKILANSEKQIFVLPTYSAMLETRKILTGKKIL